MNLFKRLQSGSVAEQFSDIIRLLSISGVGPKRALDLFNTFGSLENIFTAHSKTLQEIPGITPRITQAIKQPVESDLVEGQAYLIEKFGVELIPIWDDDYPPLLKQIYDPPMVLFCRGDKALLKNQCIGMVGTRTPSRYGKDVTTIFASGLSSHGYTIVSGAAKGIDTHVHRTCLRNQGKTIAVLGNGLDRVYPAENRDLYDDIAVHGLLVSEFIMGTKPDAQNFPRRNRIISGLSVGTVILEAAEKSGSLITAYFALDQNREVFAVPGNITSRQSHGPHHLIRQGAKLIESVDDILEELSDKFQLGTSPGQQELMISADPKEISILEHLSATDPVQIDDLAILSGQTTFALLGLLLQMEMKGLVQQMPGKYFKRK